MKLNRAGLTLVETSLSLVLASMILFGLFGFMHNRRLVIERMQQNACAIYALESMRNYIANELEGGIKPREISPELLQHLIDGHNWITSVEFINKNGTEKMVVSIQYRGGKTNNCAYVTEVRIN